MEGVARGFPFVLLFERFHLGLSGSRGSLFLSSHHVSPPPHCLDFLPPRDCESPWTEGISTILKGAQGRRFASTTPLEKSSKLPAILLGTGLVGASLYYFLEQRTPVPKPTPARSALDPQNYKNFKLKKINPYNHNTSECAFPLWVIRLIANNDSDLYSNAQMTRLPFYQSLHLYTSRRLIPKHSRVLMENLSSVLTPPSRLQNTLGKLRSLWRSMTLETCPSTFTRWRFVLIHLCHSLQFRDATGCLSLLILVTRPGGRNYRNQRASGQVPLQRWH